MDVGSEVFIESVFGVRFLKTNSGKKGLGMPVVRNPQFYFREGFCWIDVNSTFLKSRMKGRGVFDVLSMSLFTVINLPDWYYVCLINSNFISLYVDNFINNTSHFQINDARQLPIIIPSISLLEECKTIFDNAVNIKKLQFEATISNEVADEKLKIIQRKLDEKVCELYRI